MQSLRDLNEEASDFHNTFRSAILSDAFLASLRWYQEVNVRKLVPSYAFHNQHYDWYCQDFRTIVELHGKQHYDLVRFGNYSMSQARNNFVEGQRRDEAKQTAAEVAGFRYVVVPYSEEKRLNAAYIRKILEIN